jgi:ribosomal protein S18 acetylase RimI-like enzyme
MNKINIGDNSLEIRKIKRSDLEAVLDIYRQCEDFLALGPVAKASINMVLEDFNHSLIEGGEFSGIYSSNGKIIGIVDYIPHNYKGNIHYGFISLLMVSKPFRNQGFGAAIVNAIEQEMRRDPQISTIRSGVQVNNIKAIQFWTRNGYRIASGSIIMKDQTTIVELRKDFDH